MKIYITNPPTVTTFLSLRKQNSIGESDFEYLILCESWVSIIYGSITSRTLLCIQMLERKQVIYL